MSDTETGPDTAPQTPTPVAPALEEIDKNFRTYSAAVDQVKDAYSKSDTAKLNALRQDHDALLADLRKSHLVK